MGLAKVLSFLRTARNGAKVSDVKLDPGGGDNITGVHFADPGDDSHPLTTDYAATTDVPGSGAQAPVGYADIVNEPKAAEGETRKYGRDPATGLYVNEVWLKADGSVIIANANGAIELKADGSVDINGAVISAAGEVTSATGKVLSTHVHAQGNDSASDTQVPTNPPT